MNFDSVRLQSLRQDAAWSLLCAEHAPLILSFVNRVFLEPNARQIAASRLAASLEDDLYSARQQCGDDVFPKEAGTYLVDWTAKGRLRRFYVQGSDEFYFDLTTATEKAVSWAKSLEERASIGTESRLRTFVHLLREVDDGADASPERRVAKLEEQLRSLKEQIERARGGEVETLSDGAVRERFAQIDQLGTELLSDFREVEDRFRLLSQTTRERIAAWKGGKGVLLSEVLRLRTAIEDSDEGQSFRAFYEFLLSMQEQEELSERLRRVLALPALSAAGPRHRIRKIHHDWLRASEGTQRMIARLSGQLRRFLDDLESDDGRRILEVARRIERHALAVRPKPPTGEWSALEGVTCSFDLPLERPLFQVTERVELRDTSMHAGEEAELDAEALYRQNSVDREALADYIADQITTDDGVTLKNLVEARPLSQGLAELIAYLELGHTRFAAEVMDFLVDDIAWTATPNSEFDVTRTAEMPRVRYLGQA